MSNIDPTNPFKGRAPSAGQPMRVIRRFTKPCHWADIRERRVTAFRAIEFLVFVDGSLLESQMFHNGREAEYPDAIDTRLKQFIPVGGQPQAG